MRKAGRFASQLALLVLLSVLPFAVLSIGLSVSTALHYRQHSIEEMADLAETLQLTVERELQLAETALQALQTSPALDEALAAGAGGPAERLETFHWQATEVAERHLSGVLNIMLIDRQGRLVLSTLRPPGAPMPPPGGMGAPAGRQPDSPGLEPHEVVAYVLESGRTYVSDLVVSPATQKHIVGLKVPVRRNGEVVGLVGVNLLPAQLGEVLRAHLPSQGYVASVVDRAGVIVARTSREEDFIGTRATEEVQAFVRDPDARAIERPSLTADGRDVYAAFRRLDPVPWTIAYAAPRELVDAPLRQLALMMGVLGTFALALFVGSTFSLGRSLDREMSTLARDAEALGRGQPLPERAERVREVAEVREALRDGVASLAAAEQRLRLAVDASGMATWDIDVERDEIVWTGHFLEMLDLPPDARAPLPVDVWQGRVHPEDLPALIARWQLSARDESRFHAIYRIERQDGSIRWLESYGSHIRERRQNRFIGVTVDVTERHQADEQRRLLMREVDHRAKNALAVVHSVVRLTRANDVESFASAVDGRIRALARAHDLLARDRWVGAGLAELAEQELAAQIANGQVALGGSPVRVQPDAVQPLSMVLHELATNATKYGALSVSEGNVQLSWRLEPQGGPLVMRWTERGGPPTTPPAGQGFGTRLINITVKSQLFGSVTFEWQPEGLSCVIEIGRERIGSAGASAEAARPEPAEAADFQAPELAGRRVLLVEDEALIGAALAVAIREMGCEPLGPFGAVEPALVALEEAGRVDAAVLDVNLSGETSLPLARVLAGRGVPVVVVTGYSELPAEWQEPALSGMLRKPVDPGELLTVLRRALARKRAAA